MMSEKAERAAKKLERQHREELGPLFAAQAPGIDRRAIMLERRMGWARGVVHLQEHLGDKEIRAGRADKEIMYLDFEAE